MKHVVLSLLLALYIPVLLAQPANTVLNPKAPVIKSLNTLRITAAEICNNNIDDDGNGLADATDPSCYLSSVSAGSCPATPIIWSCTGTGMLYWTNINTGAQRLLNGFSIILSDIAWASDGQLYACGSFNDNGLYRLDPNLGTTQLIYSPDPARMGNSLTADNKGNLYFFTSIVGQGTFVQKLNIATGAVCTIASLSGILPAGDMTFLNGVLYIGCMSNIIAAIDVRTGRVTPHKLPAGFSLSLFGLTSIGDGYLYASSGNSVYRIDAATMTPDATPVFTLPIGAIDIYGLSAYPELCEAPTCTIRTAIQPSTLPPYCFSTGIQLTTRPDICTHETVNYTWLLPDGNTTNSNPISARQPGKYYLSYTTATETCTHIDSFDLQYTHNVYLKVDTAYQLPSECTCNGSLSVTPTCGSGNFAYLWSTGATTSNITNICGGIYSVKVTDLDLAVDTTVQFYITESNPPRGLWYSIYHAWCGIGTGHITVDSVPGGIAPFTFSLDNGPFTAQRNYDNLQPDMHSIIVKDATGCSFTALFIIEQSPAISVNIQPHDTTVCIANKITFTTTTAPANTNMWYKWNNNEAADTSFYQTAFAKSTDLFVQVTDMYGCTASDTAHIQAMRCDSVFARCLVFPNAFTPNHDGKNDAFGPHQGNCVLNNYQLIIYNRWGQSVFKASDPAVRWDGQLQPAGTYTYACTWQDILGENHLFKGVVVLIR